MVTSQQSPLPSACCARPRLHLHIPCTSGRLLLFVALEVFFDQGLCLPHCLSEGRRNCYHDCFEGEGVDDGMIHSPLVSLVVKQLLGRRCTIDHLAVDDEPDRADCVSSMRIAGDCGSAPFALVTSHAAPMT